MRTVLHTEASPGLGGQEIRTLNEAAWTAERGWRVLLAAPAGAPLLERARSQRIAATAVPMRGPWDALAVARLVRLIRRERVDLVHTHSSIDGWLGGLAGRAARVPVVRTRHVSLPIRRGWNPVYRWLADRVITSGESIRRIVIGAGVPPERVVAIPAGVDLATFRFRAAPGPGPGGLTLSRPVIGSVAMFRGSKGHAELMQAFQRVRARHPRSTLLLVGDGIRRAWVEDLARQAGLADAVVFTGFRPDVAALLEAMDCFVLASTRTEGVPQSLLQAMATGVPVVASDVGGVHEIVVDRVTGLLAEPGAVEGLADRIHRVLGDPAAAAARAAAARAVVEERFSHTASVSRLLAVYGELVGDGARVEAGQAA